ncbi:MAG: ATP synthase subunit I [Actinomycetota bacterium]|nr:ATP synthase subunit I [Actinomycetota bacterium]
MTIASNLFAEKPTGPSPELSVSFDMVKRGFLSSPLLVLVCAAIWGGYGALSSAYAIVIVLANFAVSAGIIAGGSKISYVALLTGALFGYLIRLGLIFGAVFLVRDTTWVVLPALGLSIIVAHLGLLIWETKYISMSLAYPGLKPGHQVTRLRR